MQEIEKYVKLILLVQEGMFHKAIDLRLLDGTVMSVTFEDGADKGYDMRTLFSKYMQIKALENRFLFLSGRLMGSYGISWNDGLDIEVETVGLESVQHHIN